MRYRLKLLGVLTALLMLAAACGGEDTTADADADAGGAGANTDDAGATDGGSDDTADGGGDSGESEETATPTGAITVAYSIGPITFNPHISQPGPQYGHLEAVYDTFIRTAADGSLEPGLATEWGFVDDEGLVFEMTLREGVTFHDGAVFDAEAAKANIENGMASDGARTARLDPVESVEVVDPQTVRLNLSAPSPTLPQDLSTMMGMVVSPALIGTDDIESLGVGTGPYVYDVDASVPGDRYEFVAYDGYWDESAAGRPATITLMVMTEADARLNALRSGQLTAGQINATQAETAESAGLGLVTGPDKFWGFLLQDRGGERVPELGILEVRQAMNYAVDREAIVEALAFGRGIATAQLWNPNDTHFSDEVADLYPYDPDEARRLLDSVGVDGFSFEVPILPLMSNYAQAVQEYLRDVGIDMQLVVIEPGTLGAEARSGDWAASGMIAGGIESAATDASLFITPDAIYNTFGTEDPELTAVLEQAATEPDPAARSELYQQASAIVTEQAWFLITHYADALVAHDPNVDNWEFRFEGGGVPVYRDVRVGG